MKKAKTYRLFKILTVIFSIILPLVCLIDTAYCQFSAYFNHEAHGAGVVTYEKKFFSSDDYAILENIYGISFPKGTKLEYLYGRRTFRGDTWLNLKIFLPENQRESFATQWYVSYPNMIKSKEQSMESVIDTGKLYMTISPESSQIARYKKQYNSYIFAWIGCICILTPLILITLKLKNRCKSI